MRIGNRSWGKRTTVSGATSCDHGGETNDDGNGDDKHAYEDHVRPLRPGHYALNERLAHRSG